MAIVSEIDPSASASDVKKISEAASKALPLRVALCDAKLVNSAAKALEDVDVSNRLAEVEAMGLVFYQKDEAATFFEKLEPLYKTLNTPSAQKGADDEKASLKEQESSEKIDKKPLLSKKRFEVVEVCLSAETRSTTDFPRPWLRVANEDVTGRNKLLETYKKEITEVPTMLILSGEDAQILTQYGVRMVQQDPTGAKFPWKGMGKKWSENMFVRALLRQLPMFIMMGFMWFRSYRDSAAKQAALKLAKSNTVVSSGGMENVVIGTGNAQDGGIYTEAGIPNGAAEKLENPELSKMEALIEGDDEYDEDDEEEDDDAPRKPALSVHDEH